MIVVIEGKIVIMIVIERLAGLLLWLSDQALVCDRSSRSVRTYDIVFIDLLIYY